MSNAYKNAGVDVHAGYETVERIRKHVKSTYQKGVIGALGGFGGLFDLGALNYKHPVLVSGTDGVGTKILLAIQEEKYDTIGIDCVAMCVNDVVAQGAKPLFFLDYIAVGKNNPEIVEQIVAGVAHGCVQAGAALIGGETAEMPDLYADNDFDLAGFTVGASEKDELIQGNTIKEGDVLIGLPSSGIHSNGYSLVRKLFFKDKGYDLSHHFPQLEGRTLGEELLTPTKIYVSEVLAVHELGLIKGVAHITGGGFIENIPRMLPEDISAKISLGSWPMLPIFEILQEEGQLTLEEMYGTFNMGIGMVIAVGSDKAAEVLEILSDLASPAYVIGQTISKTPSQITTTEVIL